MKHCVLNRFCQYQSMFLGTGGRILVLTPTGLILLACRGFTLAGFDRDSGKKTCLCQGISRHLMHAPYKQSDWSKCCSDRFSTPNRHFRQQTYSFRNLARFARIYWVFAYLARVTLLAVVAGSFTMSGLMVDNLESS